MVKDACDNDKKLGPVEDVLYETKKLYSEHNVTSEQAKKSLDLETEIQMAPASADIDEISLSLEVQTCKMSPSTPSGIM